MNKKEIIEKVKSDYECVLVEFEVYDTPEELYEAKKNVLSNFANETLGEFLGEEDNVFRVEEKWIYAAEWHDSEWDD